VFVRRVLRNRFTGVMAKMVLCSSGLVGMTAFLAAFSGRLRFVRWLCVVLLMILCMALAWCFWGGRFDHAGVVKSMGEIYPTGVTYARFRGLIVLVAAGFPYTSVSSR